MQPDHFAAQGDGAVEQGLERILALDPRPTAIVCSCDPVALSLLGLLAARGLRVPKDMSVVSFGGSDEVKAARPSVTALEMPMHTIGRVIPELIERRMADPKAAPISVQFEATLFVGGSVSTPPRDAPARHAESRATSASKRQGRLVRAAADPVP